mmetsp:Transcript_28974/g.68911  ORF Transcript_28974/g.68911 Transcript_28974/m.68911 type:complete len:472 (-) Transcript_28974:807-2222(-)
MKLSESGFQKQAFPRSDAADERDHFALLHLQIEVVQSHLRRLLAAEEVATADLEAGLWAAVTLRPGPDVHPLRDTDSWENWCFFLLQVILHTYSTDADGDEALNASRQRRALRPQRSQDLQASEDRGQVVAAVQVQEAPKTGSCQHPRKEIEENDEMAAKPEVDSQHGQLSATNPLDLFLHRRLPGITFHDANALQDFSEQIDTLVLNILQLHHVDPHRSAEDHRHGEGWNGDRQAEESGQAQLESHEHQQDGHCHRGIDRQGHVECQPMEIADHVIVDRHHRIGLLGHLLGQLVLVLGSNRLVLAENRCRQTLRLLEHSHGHTGDALVELHGKVGFERAQDGEDKWLRREGCNRYQDGLGHVRELAVILMHLFLQPEEVAQGHLNQEHLVQIAEDHMHEKRHVEPEQPLVPPELADHSQYACLLLSTIANLLFPEGLESLALAKCLELRPVHRRDLVRAALRHRTVPRMS